MFWHNFAKQRLRNLWETNVQFIEGYVFVCHNFIVLSLSLIQTQTISLNLSLSPTYLLSLMLVHFSSISLLSLYLSYTLLLTLSSSLLLSHHFHTLCHKGRWWREKGGERGGKEEMRGWEYIWERGEIKRFSSSLLLSLFLFFFYRLILFLLLHFNNLSYSLSLAHSFLSVPYSLSQAH